MSRHQAMTVKSAKYCCLLINSEIKASSELALKLSLFSNLNTVLEVVSQHHSHAVCRQPETVAC